MALTDAEKVTIRRHLGLNAANAALYPWVPTHFAVSEVLDTLPATTETECRAILTRLDAIESSMEAAIGRLKASVVGSITLNAAETSQLREERQRWRRELSTLLGVPMTHTSGNIMVT